jgi:hypothetical protein
MLATYSLQALRQAGPTELSDALERGRIVHFPECPIPLPSPEEQTLLREALPQRLRGKNVSYYPEARRLTGLTADPALQGEIQRLLVSQGERVREFLRAAMPAFTRGWRVGTTSFRPLQERGRNLSAHASNERVHVDAGAYGATHGGRILRFFVNLNPREDRVWATKGTFTQLHARYAQAAGLTQDGTPPSLEYGPLDRLRSGALKAAAKLGLPMVQVLDSSPYDRLMRRFHNFMKDTPEVQQTQEGHEELSFAPYSAWMVLTDGVSHACLSGQFAFVDTFVIPLESCRLPEESPYGVLRAGRGAAGARQAA